MGVSDFFKAVGQKSTSPPTTSNVDDEKVKTRVPWVEK